MIFTFDVEKAFEKARPALEKLARGPVFLVKVIGARWSFVAGTVPEDLPFERPRRILLGDKWALVAFCPDGNPVKDDVFRAVFLEKAQERT